MARFFASLLLLLVFALPAVAGPIYRNVRYSVVPEGVDPNLLSLDAYLPDGPATQWPVMIYVHGGGWSIGDKSNVGLKAQSFNEHGFAFVSVNYRLSPLAQFPTHAQDVAAAIAYVQRNAEAFGADPMRIHLMGHSAGAHLVSLVATDARYLQAEGMHPRDLTAVISLDTQAYDLHLLSELNGGSLPDAYARVFGTTPEQLAFASPRTYVSASAAIPPMIAAYSKGINGNELEERRTATERFVGAVSAAGNLTRIIPAPEKFHDQINAEFGGSDDAVTADTYQFLQLAAFYRQRGLWYDPSRSGHGVDLQFAADHLFGLFYTYDDDGSPSWLVLDSANAVNASSTALINRYRHVDGVAELDRIAGSARLDYGVAPGDCAGNPLAQAAPVRLRLQWTIDSVAGDWCLVPLLPAQSAPSPNANGTWYAGETDSGWGLSLGALADSGPGVTIRILYYYDGAGAPRWSLAQGNLAQLEQTLPLQSFQGYCRSCAPTQLVPISAGEISAQNLLQAPAVRLRAVSVDGSSFERDSPIQELSDPVR